MEDGNRLGMWVAWGFALFWNLVSLPGAVLAVRAALEEGKSTALIALIFPVVGIGLLAWAVRATLRYRRYGVSVLELRSTPGVVGRSLAGAVRTTSLLHPTEGFQIQLTSLRRTVRGGGKHRSTSETILWQESTTARGQPSRTAQGMSTAIPFAFAIPGDAEPCDAGDPRNQVLWRLRVSASVPGVDYESTFEVPVFRTAASELPGTDTDGAVEPLVPADYRQPPESRIQVSATRRGTVILFPSARNPGAAAGLTAFLALWLGAIGAMLALGAPVFLPVIFGLFALLMLWGVLEMWLRTTRVSSDGNSVVVASGYLAPSGERRFSRAEIAGVRTKIGMQAGETVYYDLQLRRADGKAVTVGHGIRDKREAEWLAATLSDALGLAPVSATGGPGSRTR